MRIYKIAQLSESEVRGKFLSEFKPESLRGLAAEAIKCNSFDDFKRQFLVDIKHGTYWHITDNPNFAIDPESGPRDMSSMGGDGISKGALMVTSDLESWVSEYPNREYAAEVDLSMLDPSDYRQVARGFGNEFFIFNAENVKVIRVVPISYALKISGYRNRKLPQDRESLELFFNNVTDKYQQYINSARVRENENL